MGARQWEVCAAVIEAGRFPCRCGVATLTIVRELIARMTWVVGVNVVRFMTRPAISRCSGELPADVTGSTICLNVSAGQREIREIVVKLGRMPGRRGVTLRAVLGIAAGSVIRIVRVSIIGLMTRVAVTRQLRVLSIYVTLRAGSDNVRPGERKGGVRVIECGGSPSSRRMTLLTAVGHQVGCVIRAFCFVIVGLMTTPTISRRAGELPARVARGTFG